MELKKWEELPDYMQNDKVKRYYKILSQKKKSLRFKRIVDIIMSIIKIISKISKMGKTPIAMVTMPMQKIQTQIIKMLKITKNGIVIIQQKKK